MKNENCWMASFDSLKEVSWFTDCNAKNQNSFWLTIFEKVRLDHQKNPKNKFKCFVVFPIFFFKTDHAYRLFECLYEVSWSTKFNSTETSHVLCTILEEIGKNCKKGQFFLDLLDNQFLLFQKSCIRKLSNITIWRFSFITFVRGYPY